MNVFGYGSNMLIERLRAANRSPNATKVANASIRGRSLRFHKLSTDRSGKCDLFETRSIDDTVHGVVFDVPTNEMSALRTAEGVGHGYHETTVKVTLGDGKELDAKAFVADVAAIRAGARPYTWYKRLVLAGAKQNALPPNYIATISAAPEKRDRDTARSTKREAEAALRQYRMGQKAAPQGRGNPRREGSSRRAPPVCAVASESPNVLIPAARGDFLAAGTQDSSTRGWLASRSLPFS